VDYEELINRNQNIVEYHQMVFHFDIILDWNRDTGCDNGSVTEKRLL